MSDQLTYLWTIRDVNPQPLDLLHCTASHAKLRRFLKDRSYDSGVVNWRSEANTTKILYTTTTVKYDHGSANKNYSKVRL